MPNGKPGDSPFTDILYGDREVFHPKVDQLIRDLHEAGGLDGPFARDYINLKHAWLEMLPAAWTWSEAEAAAKRRTVLGNFARELYRHLQDARGSDRSSWEARRIPEHYDPDPGTHREFDRPT